MDLLNREEGEVVSLLIFVSYFLISILFFLVNLEFIDLI